MATQRVQNSDVVESTESVTSNTSSESEYESSADTKTAEQSRDDDGSSTESSGSESEDESGGSPSSPRRQSPSRRNATDAYGLPYLTVLPRPERKRITLEIRRKRKPGN